MTLLVYKQPTAPLAPAPHVLLLESGLPSKPLDPEGRHVAWVLVTAEPGIWYRDQFIQVDEEWIDRQVQLHQSLQSVAPRGGYRAPLLSEHVRAGERIGDILEVRKSRVDGAQALIAAVAFSSPDAADKIQRQEIKYFSPGFGSVQDSGTGQEYTMILNEISQVSAPHQKGFGPSHVLAKEIDMGAQLQLEEVVDEKIDEKIDEKKEIKIERSSGELWERIDYLERRIDELYEYNRKMVEAEEAILNTEEKPVEVEASEISTLKAKVDGLELERDLAQYKGFVSGNPTITLSEGLKGILFGAWRQDKIKVSELIKTSTTSSTTAKLSEYTSSLGSAQTQVISSDPEKVYHQTLAKTQDAVAAMAAFKRAKNIK